MNDHSGAKSVTELGRSENLKRYFAYGLFVSGLFLYALVHFHRNCIPGQIYNDFSADLGLNASQMASIGATIMYVYAFMQLANGMLVDKFGGCRVLLCGSIFTLTGSWLFVATDQYWCLILSRILTGIGIGLTYLAMLDITKWSFPKNFRIMTGFFIAFGQIGGAVGTAPFAACCHAFGWLNCLKTIATLTSVMVVLFIVFFWLVDKPPVAKKPLRLRNYLTVLFNKCNLLNILSSSFSYGVFYGFFTLIMKKFLQDCYGMSSEGASSVCCAMLVMQAVFNQTFGILASKFNSKSRFLYRMVLVVTFVCCVLVLILTFFRGSVSKPLVIVLVNIMGMIAGCTPISLEVTRNLNSPELSSTAIGFNNSTAYVFSGIFTSMTGFVLGCFSEGYGIAEKYSPKAYMTLLAVNSLLLLVPIVISRFIPDYKGKNIYKPSFQLFGIGKP